MAKLVRWEPPRLHEGEEQEEAKFVSVDLFYDLVFAVVVAQLATTFADDITSAGLLTFTLFLVPAIRLWIGQTLYSDRFEAVDVSHRLFVFAAMLAAAGLAVAAPTALTTGFSLYSISLIASHVLLTAQWLRARHHEPRARAIASRYVLFFSIESLLWAVAIVMPVYWRLWLIAAAMVTDLVLPLTTTHSQDELGDFSQEHLGDRFVDFFLVILGQVFIVAILIMTRSRTPTIADVEAGILSLALAFILWWVYVDHVVGRPLREGSPWHAAWVYLHIPLFMGAAAFGSGFFPFVARGESFVPPPTRWLLCGSFAVVLLFSGLAEIALEPLRATEGRLRRAMTIHGVPAVLSVVLGVIGVSLNAPQLLGFLIVFGLFAILGGEYYRTPD